MSAYGGEKGNRMIEIALGADHAGYTLKEALKRYFDETGVSYCDFGTFSEESVDYPDIAKKTCEAVLDGRCRLAVLVCGTGVGIGISANKIKGIRACVCSEVYSAKMSRLHNDANTLAIGGRVIGVETAKEIVNVFIHTQFLGGRHQTRVDKISDLEYKKYE